MLKAIRFVAVCGVLAGASVASGTPILVDLTPGPGSSGSINGAIFQFDAVQPAGTGVFDPFVRIQMNGTEEGYNTSGRPLPFDEKDGPWTKDVRVSELLALTLGQVSYYAFSLDINESNSPSGRFLSLDEVRVFTTPVAGQTTTNLSSLGTLRYHLDSASGAPSGNHRVLMNAANTHGSGQSDMTMFIPVSQFAGAGPDDYVVLYSHFGLSHSSTAGFEEWAVAVPEPGSAAMMLVGAGALMLRRRRARA